MALLAVSLALPNTDAALAALRKAAPLADAAELRLDLMDEFDLPRLLDNSPLPVIVTCRPAREGGGWRASEPARLAVLQRAADLGADYVDLEWDASHHLASLKQGGAKVILSRHHFSDLPADLATQADDLWTAGADVVKLAAHARRLADASPVFELLARAAAPTIAIAMGACGLATRLLASCYSSALLSFAALPGAASATAPGQIDADAMTTVYRTRQISPTTAIVGWLAEDANLSPAVVKGNRWLAARGLDARLAPLQLARGEAPDDALQRLARWLPLRGCLTPDEEGLLCWTPASDAWSPAQNDLPAALASLLPVGPEASYGA